MIPGLVTVIFSRHTTTVLTSGGKICGSRDCLQFLLQILQSSPDWRSQLTETQVPGGEWGVMFECVPRLVSKSNWSGETGDQAKADRPAGKWNKTRSSNTQSPVASLSVSLVPCSPWHSCGPVHVNNVQLVTEHIHSDWFLSIFSKPQNHHQAHQ